jgi:hypothetical protein
MITEAMRPTPPEMLMPPSTCGKSTATKDKLDKPFIAPVLF